MIGLESLGLRWRQMRFNPLRSLTPERLAAALDSWDAGWLRDAALIFETIARREAIVGGTLAKRASAVARRDWEIVVPDPDDPRGEQHKETLEHFYDNLTTTDATDLNVRSGMSGLIRQLMDAILQRYAVHEIVWQPGDDGLTAELRRVPIYFFENRSGRLRYTGPENRADGTPLEDDGWLITTADGLGHALAILYMYRRLGVQDWVAYSEKFSIPGVLGRTSAKSGTPEATAFEAAVAAFGSEWVGTITGDDGSIPEPLKIITAGGGTGLPQKELAEYCDRMIAALVRGSDLGTLSRGDSTGASMQADEATVVLEDDCALVSENLQQLDKLVIRMVHGDDDPAAYIIINPPSTKDLAKDLAIDTGLAALGITQDPEDVAERYGRSVKTEDKKTEDRRLEDEDAGELPSGASGSENGIAAPSVSSVSSVVTDAAANESDPDSPPWLSALTTDLQPLGRALESAMNAGDEAAMRAALKKISDKLPDFLTATNLEDNLSAAFAADLTEETDTP
jgi:phage gp29-like protein